MEYRITVRSNPRLIGLFLIIVALPAAGVVAFLLTSVIVAVLILGAGLFFSYNFIKLVRSTLASRIRTNASGVVFDFGKGHRNEFDWNRISHCGVYSEPKRGRALFIYDEEDDRLVTVPNEYESFDVLVTEVREHTVGRFEIIDLGALSTIEEYLREKVTPPAGEKADTE